MKVIYYILVANGLLLLFAAIGLVAFMGATGRLKADRLQTLRKWWAGVELVEPQPEKPQQAPTEEKTSSEAAVEAQQQAEEKKRRDIDLQMAQLKAMYDTVELARLRLVAEQQKLEQQRRQLQEQLASDRTDEKFKKTLEIYSSMNPKQVKDLWMATPEEQVVSFMMKMEPRIVAKIVRQFRSEEEMQKLRKLMERLSDDKREQINLAAGTPNQSTPQQ